jgi:hypothetical protein
MAGALSEQQLLEKAQAYLKNHYGEDTVRMDVLNNSVEDGCGALSVECTVSIGGSHSDWRKVFTFKNGNVTNMTWRQL